MSIDSFQIANARSETREELLSRQKTWKSDSPQNIIATVELARREEVKNFIRFWVGFAVVGTSLIIGTVAIIRYLWG
jgi:hypothetical protein